MKGRINFVACFWLIWLTLTVIADEPKQTFKVDETSDQIKITCTDSKHKLFEKDESTHINTSSVTLRNKGDLTAEFECRDETNNVQGKIFVQFRSCDNCIEFDAVTIAGIGIGDLVVTFFVGVSVFIIVSQAKPSAVVSSKKASDKQQLIPKADSSQTYQRLRPRDKDEYGVLSTAR